MPEYKFIKSKLSGYVIDVVGASSNAGAGLDAYPQKSSGTDSQLWEFVPDRAGSPYYFIKSKLNGNVIDIQDASTKAGSLLDAWPQKSSGTDNQLWEFVADPAGSGYCFIKSKLNGNVIDIQGASTEPGAQLDAYPWKLTGYDNQLWTVVDGSFPSVVGTVAPGRNNGKQLNSGYYNYVLANGSRCANLTGVKVTIYFTEDLVWESSNNPHVPGFSVQLNAETNSSQPLDWLQFMTHIGNDQSLYPWINIWGPVKSTPDLIWDQTVPTPVATMPQAARIPAGYSIVVALHNDNTWSAQVELTDRATATGPALALNNGVLCMAWQGIGQNNIWVAVSRDNGATWSSQTELTDRATVDAPALTVVNGKFAMAWRGLGQDNIWVSTSDDGLSWSPQTELNDRSTSAGPGLASDGHLAVMAWKGTGQTNIWVSTSTDGIHWSAQVELTDRASQFGPRVAAGSGKFAMAWCGIEQNNIWVSTSTDGISWTPQKELTDRATTASPAIGYSSGLDVFYMAWRGLQQDNIWVSSSADGVNWTPQLELQDRSCDNGPALSAVAKTLYMAWQGSGQNNIWTSILIDGAEGRITSASWSVFDSSGNSIGNVTYPLSTTEGGGISPGDLSPIASFQVTFGGAMDSAYATFSSGAGVMILQADQAMTVDWWPTCIGFTGGTAESSNVAYSVLEAKPNTLFSQAFGVLPDSAQMREANPNARKR